jgi:hypothetical protein
VQGHRDRGGVQPGVGEYRLDRVEFRAQYRFAQCLPACEAGVDQASADSGFGGDVGDARARVLGQPPGSGPQDRIHVPRRIRTHIAKLRLRDNSAAINQAGGLFEEVNRTISCDNSQITGASRIH